MESFEGRFTDWRAGTHLIGRKENTSRCLVLAEQGSHWEHAPCISSNHFACDIPPENWVPAKPKMEPPYGEKRCFEKFGNGTFSVDETDCFYLVKLQYSNEMARQFCRQHFNGSLAQVDMDRRYQPELDRYPELGEKYSDTHTQMKIF